MSQPRPAPENSPDATAASAPPDYPEDPGNLQSSEDLDEDELDADPLEEGIEPPEDWSAADRYGTTASEQQAGGTLDYRLAEEERDSDAADEPPDEQLEAAGDELPRSAETRPADLDEGGTDSGVMLEGEWVNPAGLSASSRAGQQYAAEPDSPEEAAERTEPEEE